jgi:hypothetical protein
MSATAQELDLKPPKPLTTDDKFAEVVRIVAEQYGGDFHAYWRALRQQHPAPDYEWPYLGIPDLRNRVRSR